MPVHVQASKFSPITLGRRVRSFDLEGFRLIESVYSPCLVLPQHAHEFATISVVRQGSFIEVLAGRPKQCNPFDLIVEPAGEVHSDQFGPSGAVCFHIVLTPERLRAVPPLSTIFDRAPHVRGGSLPTLAIRIEQELKIMDNAAALTIEGLIFELLAQVVRFGQKELSSALPGWLRQARDLIHENVGQQLSLHRVAECVGVHPAHLAKNFRKHYQCSVGDYLRRVRVDTAIQLMVQSSRSLAEVAIAVGFYDQSHFTNAFKRHTGVSPAKFRAQIQQDKARTRILLSSKTF